MLESLFNKVAGLEHLQWLLSKPVRWTVVVNIWNKVFQNGTSEFFKGCIPQTLLDPFLNTLSHIKQEMQVQVKINATIDQDFWFQLCFENWLVLSSASFYFHHCNRAFNFFAKKLRHGWLTGTKIRLLTLSWRSFLSYRPHSIDLLCISMDWFFMS